jgi:hypothetical protein
MGYRFFLLLFLSLSSITVFAQPVPVNITPRPQTVTIKEGNFKLASNVKLVADAGLEHSTAFLTDYLHKFYEIEISQQKLSNTGSGDSGIINL